MGLLYFFITVMHHHPFLFVFNLLLSYLLSWVANTFSWFLIHVLAVLFSSSCTGGYLLYASYCILCYDASCAVVDTVAVAWWSGCSKLAVRDCLSMTTKVYNMKCSRYACWISTSTNHVRDVAMAGKSLNSCCRYQMYFRWHSFNLVD